MTDPLNILTVIAGIILICVVIIIEGFFILNLRTKELAKYFEKLQKIILIRQDLLPFFLETYKEHFPEDKKNLQVMIELRDLARKEKGKDFLLESKISESIEQFLLGLGKNKKINKDLKFLEIKQELIDITKLIDNLVYEYNLRVEKFNFSRLNPLFFIISKIKDIPRKPIFKFKSFTKIS